MDIAITPMNTKLLNRYHIFKTRNKPLPLRDKIKTCRKVKGRF